MPRRQIEEKELLKSGRLARELRSGRSAHTNNLCKQTIFSIKKFLKFYTDNNERTEMGGKRTSSPSPKLPKHGTPSPASKQLGKDNLRSMGPSANTGSCTRTDKHTLPGISPQRDPALSGPKQTFSRGDKDTTREKSSVCSATPSRGGLYLKDVCNPQERRRSETNYRPQRSEQIHPLGTFQDGGNPSDKGSPPTGGLASKDRPEGRLLCCANQTLRSPPSTFPKGSSNISIQLPAIWPILCPQDLHKDHKTNHSMASPTWLQDDQLHRRQSADGQLKTRSVTDGPASCDSIRTPWVHNKLPEIHPRTDPINSISGVFSEYSRDDHHSPSNQNVKNDRGGKQTANCEPNHGKRACQPHRDSIINDDSHSPSTTFLQSFASSKELCATDSNGTRYPHCPPSSSKGRAPMVVRTGSSMEWLLSTSPRKTTQNTDRCIKDRVGRSLSREKNGRPLVPGGGQESHQLSRATSNISSHPNFCQPPIQHNNPDTDRQHICNDIHQQEGWHTVRPPDSSGKRMLVLLHEEEDQPGSRTSTGTLEHNSRRRVSNDEGQMGLEAPPHTVKNNVWIAHQ